MGSWIQEWRLKRVRKSLILLNAALATALGGCGEKQAPLDVELPRAGPAAVTAYVADHPDTDYSKPVKVIWWRATINKNACEESPKSPAEDMRDIQSYGRFAKTTDLANGGVEVGYDSSANYYYTRYYASQQSCLSSLPRAQSVPSRYE